MKFYICLVICFFLQAQGAPLAQITPCLNQLRQLQADIRRPGYVPDENHYIPECESDGVAWKPAQCSHHDQGYCFCVDTETGVRIQGTVSHIHTKETLNCASLTTPEEKLCQKRRKEIKKFRSVYPGVPDLPLEYFPECLDNGSFKARQRNQKFFCVDTVTGEKIPGTETVSKPITEEICQSYSRLWQSYITWVRTSNQVTNNHQDPSENVTASSCPAGFEFLECGCNKPCVLGTNMTTSQSTCDQCKPVCTCPDNYYEYNGTCITAQQCFDLEPVHSVIDIKGSLWTQYESQHATEDLKAYNAILSELPEVEGSVKDVISETIPQEEQLPETTYYPETSYQSTNQPSSNQPTATTEDSYPDEYIDYSEPTIVEEEVTQEVTSQPQSTTEINGYGQNGLRIMIEEPVDHQKEEIELQEEVEEEMNYPQEYINNNEVEESNFEELVEEHYEENMEPEFADEYLYEDSSEQPTTEEIEEESENESLPDALTRYLSGAATEVESEKPSFIFDLLALGSAAPPDNASLAAKKSG